MVLLNHGRETIMEEQMTLNESDQMQACVCVLKLTK